MSAQEVEQVPTCAALTPPAHHPGPHHVVPHAQVGDDYRLADLAQRVGTLKQLVVHGARDGGEEVDGVQGQAVLCGEGRAGCV
jgi:hypothetical protein